jgi:hypothetical protein
MCLIWNLPMISQSLLYLASIDRICIFILTFSQLYSMAYSYHIKACLWSLTDPHSFFSIFLLRLNLCQLPKDQRSCSLSAIWKSSQLGGIRPSLTGNPRDLIGIKPATIRQHLTGTILTSHEPTEGGAAVSVDKGIICIFHPCPQTGSWSLFVSWICNLVRPQCS